MRMLIGMTCVALALVILTANHASSASDGDPKYTISDVMKKAHAGKNPVLNKVKSGQATEAEAKNLLEMYQALAKNKPPLGDAASWKSKTDALIEGAKLYVDGKKDDSKTKLATAAKCADCHKVHKG